MASSRAGSSVIQFEEHEDKKSELQFQDFDHGDAATLETSEYSSSFPGSPNLDNENAGLLSEEKKPSAFWEFSYYQSFFDVDTEQVMQRIIWSMVPLRGRATYLDRVIRPTPDLYGPFWISTTLIFSLAISANIAQYFMSEGQDKRIWHYDFHKVSLAATAIYSYTFLLPLALWGLMWYRKSSTRYTLLEIICVYGYSLFIYIPISILWLIQVTWLQWTLVIIGAALSGVVLAYTFWPTVRDENKKIAVVALCLILLFHTLLAVGFVAFFFRPPNSAKSHPIIVITPTSLVAHSDSVITDSSKKEQKIVSRDIEVKNSSIVNKLPDNVIKDKNPPIKRKTNDVSNLSTPVVISENATKLSTKFSFLNLLASDNHTKMASQNVKPKNTSFVSHSAFDKEIKNHLEIVTLNTN